MLATIIIADDDQAFRSVLKRLLEKERELSVVGEAADGLEAIDRARALSPDIILMDLAMPRLNGLEATRIIKTERPAHYANYLLEGEHTMPIFFFSVKVTPASETELKEVAAPDFVRAVQTLAAWRPGIHILKLEGIHTGSPAHAGGDKPRTPGKRRGSGSSAGHAREC